MSDSIWEVIKDSLMQVSEAGVQIPVLSGNKTFKVKVDTDSLQILFPQTNTYLKLEESRFVSGYHFLREHRGKWVKIGASRVNTKPDTLEGRIKTSHGGKMNGLSTATWVAAILEYCFRHIVLNKCAKGQALMML